MKTSSLSIGLALLLASFAVVGDEPEIGEELPLSQAELDQISADVLAKNPLLASSPGIKFAHAQRSVRSTDIADIIFYPHAELAGLKQAFQVQCRRQGPVETWICSEAEIRSYLKLATQEFEVRVGGGIEMDVALALIEATRLVAHAAAIDQSKIANTAVAIWPRRDRYLVTWGSAEGFQTIITQAFLPDDGDPTDPADWQAELHKP